MEMGWHGRSSVLSCPMPRDRRARARRQASATHQGPAQCRAARPPDRQHGRRARPARPCARDRAGQARAASSGHHRHPDRPRRHRSRARARWPDALARLRLAASFSTHSAAQFTRFTALDPWLIDAIWRVADGKPDNAAKDEAFGAAQQRARDQRAARRLARDGGAASVPAMMRSPAWSGAQQDLKASLETLDKRA